MQKIVGDKIEFFRLILLRTEYKSTMQSLTSHLYDYQVRSWLISLKYAMVIAEGPQAPF
jgi:hypothetical protein